MNRQAERVIEDLKDVVKDTRDLVGVTAADLVDKAYAAEAQLRKSIRVAKNACEELQDKAVAGRKLITKAVRNHPYQAAGIALVAALVVGWLIGRSRR
jgi:ElaB/YqjD/DUF883 family membrane-anchored ribosome-binding protein